MSREIDGTEYALSILGPARRIGWEGDFPGDLRAMVEPVFTPLEVMLPTWCQQVWFRFTPVEESTLKIELSIRNRWALIRICPMWIAMPLTERQSSMIHELCHALIEPFHFNAVRALQAHGPEKGTPAREFVDLIVRDGLEQAVEDMARAFHRVMYSG